MMADLRSKGRVPYGYEIVDGKAVINQAEASILKAYFELYLSGLSMAQAGRKAGLQCSSTTFRNRLKRKEYCGTDYYPPLVTPEYQSELAAEWEKRKGGNPGRPRKQARKGVRIHTGFRMGGAAVHSGDPAGYASLLYGRIRPDYRKKGTPDYRKKGTPNG